MGYLRIQPDYVQLRRLRSQRWGWEAVVCSEMLNKYKLMWLRWGWAAGAHGVLLAALPLAALQPTARGASRRPAPAPPRRALGLQSCSSFSLLKRTCRKPFIEETVWKKKFWLFIYLSNDFCELNGLHRCTARHVSELNSTAAEHIVPPIAERDISCSDCTFRREPVWWDVSTSYAINRPAEYRFQSPRNTFLISWGK